MYFRQIFGLSKLPSRPENVSQKGIAGQEFGSQSHLPNRNLAFKITYQTRIWQSNILTGHVLFFVQKTISYLKF